MAKRESRQKSEKWARARNYILFPALAIIAIIIVVSFGMWLLKWAGAFNAEIALTLLLISGIAALVIVLASMAVAYAAIGLSNKAQALALPEGSVRAVLALGLVLIFAIQSVYLFGQLANVKTATSEGVTQEQLNSMPKEQIISIQARQVGEQTVYDVARQIEKSKASEDIAKQILTTISTLAVAVAAFYFGAKSVAAARGQEEEGVISEPFIRRVSPNEVEYKEGGINFIIRGKNIQSPREIKLVKYSSDGAVEVSIPAEIKKISSFVDSSTIEIECGFKLEKDKAAGEWDLVVVNQDGETASLDRDEWLKVKMPPETPPVVPAAEKTAENQPEPGEEQAQPGAGEAESQKNKTEPAAEDTDSPPPAANAGAETGNDTE